MNKRKGVKEFFSPTKWKIVITILFLGMLFLDPFIKEISPLFSDFLRWTLFILSRIFPLTIDYIPNPLMHIIIIIIFLLPSLIFWYLLSCIIMWLLGKLKNK